uniref:Uncharacterized protein n=1 Tax=Mantoniella antarctica TaxID=81844 RepID=A0A7S0SIM2_9CHLO
MYTREEREDAAKAAFGEGNFSRALSEFVRAAELCIVRPSEDVEEDVDASEDDEPKEEQPPVVFATGIHTLFGNIAAVLTKLGRFQEAVEAADHAVFLNPEWAKGYFRKGAALFALGRPHEAVAAYDAGLEVEPNNVDLTQGRTLAASEAVAKEKELAAAVAAEAEAKEKELAAVEDEAKVRERNAELVAEAEFNDKERAAALAAIEAAAAGEGDGSGVSKGEEPEDAAGASGGGGVEEEIHFKKVDEGVTNSDVEKEIRIEQAEEGGAVEGLTDPNVEQKANEDPTNTAPAKDWAAEADEGLPDPEAGNEKQMGEAEEQLTDAERYALKLEDFLELTVPSQVKAALKRKREEDVRAAQLLVDASELSKTMAFGARKNPTGDRWEDFFCEQRVR